jgi:hypothetical protein
MHAQMSLVCNLVQDKIFTILSFSLHHRYIPITRLYTQNLAFRLLILGIQNHEITKCDKLAKLHFK